MANNLTSPEQIEQDIIAYFAVKLLAMEPEQAAQATTMPAGVGGMPQPAEAGGMPQPVNADGTAQTAGSDGAQGAESGSEQNVGESVEDSAHLKQLFNRALKEDLITMAEEAEFLKTIPATFTIYPAQEVFDRIIVDAKQKQILAIVTGHTTINWQDVTVGDLAKFVSAPRRKQPDYRTPVGFADLRRRFLSEVKHRSDTNQLDAYIKAMNLFEEKLYGQRFDYYRQFELMRREAQAMGEDIDTSHKDDLATATDELSAETERAHYKQAITSAQLLKLAEISDEHQQQLLGHAVIEGDMWRQGHQDYQLNIASLVSAGLVPKHELTIEKNTIYLSSVYMLTGGQAAVMAFVPVNGDVKVRSYYRDKNQALWRYLPDYIRDLSGEGIDVFGVGFDEHATILPAELQAALNQIEKNHGVLDLSGTNPDFLFAGTAYAYNTRQEFRDAYSKGLLRGDFYREVASYAINSSAENLITKGRRKNVPQLLSLPPEQEPNFQQLLVHYSVHSDFAGEVNAQAFWSEDRQTIWLFYNDYRNRCYVANLETTSPITSTGCRKEWYLPTDLETPLYEASGLADGYGDLNDSRTGNYLAMWDGYLSKIPLIQEYTKVLAGATGEE